MDDDLITLRKDGNQRVERIAFIKYAEDIVDKMYLSVWSDESMEMYVWIVWSKCIKKLNKQYIFRQF